jgi:glucose/arabinose dehydrogenase
MIFTERPGAVSAYEGGRSRLLGKVEAFEEGEGGLLGVAVDPGFDSNAYIYLYYTRRDANRVSRFILDDNGLSGETPILDRIPRARFHNGGRIAFGPDGKLYITAGDALDPPLAQDRNSLAGKILRLNKDGSVPSDNPFGNAVWAYGLRNPQSLAWHPQTRELYVTDHGPSAHDEIDRIERGGNYGWPRECGEPDSGIAPARCYTEFTLAPSGAAFMGDDLFVAGLRGEQLRRVSIRNGKAVSEGEFLKGYGRMRTVVARGGWLYVGTSNRDGRARPRGNDDRILRVRVESAS